MLGSPRVGRGKRQTRFLPAEGGREKAERGQQPVSVEVTGKRMDKDSGPTAVATSTLGPGPGKASGSPCRGLGDILAQSGRSDTNREDHHCSLWTKKLWPRESNGAHPESHSQEAAAGLQKAPLASRSVSVPHVPTERGETRGFRKTLCPAPALVCPRGRGPGRTFSLAT